MNIFSLLFVLVQNTLSIGQGVGLYGCTAVSTCLEVDNLEVISKPIFPDCEFEEQELSEACSESSLIHFIHSELQCPAITKEELTLNKIVFSLFIDEKGIVAKVEFLRDEDHPCRNAIELVCKNIPKMIPAKKNNIPIEYVYTFPINVCFK